MFRILVVEDDKNARKLINMVLKQAGFKVFLAEDGLIALDIMDKEHIDLAIIDVMMPNMDGYELTEQLRDAYKNLPILMATAKSAPADKHKGFLLGTDDYITKPFDIEELVLRVKALLRRAKVASEHKLFIGDTVLDYSSLTVSFDDKVVDLPQKEFQLLFKLLSYPNMIFTRIQLMDEIWGLESETSDHTLNVHVNRLREKFKDCNDFEITTVRGLGYKAVKTIERTKE